MVKLGGQRREIGILCGVVIYLVQLPNCKSSTVSETLWKPTPDLSPVICKDKLFVLKWLFYPKFGRSRYCLCVICSPRRSDRPERAERLPDSLDHGPNSNVQPSRMIRGQLPLEYTSGTAIWPHGIADIKKTAVVRRY